MRGYVVLPFTMLKTALRFSRYPSYCTHTVTFRCNFKCVMCDSWKKPLEDELTVPEIREIFSQIGRLDVIKISGGEPFVRLDLADIINTIDETSSPEFIHITTNGSLKDRILKTLGALRSKRKLHVRVSIDAIGRDHDRVRGVRGAFGRRWRPWRPLWASAAGTRSTWLSTRRLSIGLGWRAILT